MRKSILVGVAYFGCVFAAASVLGVLRTVLVVQLWAKLSRWRSIILALAWITCRWLGNRLEVLSRFVSRVVMGTTAFVLLMAGELSISLLLAGRSAAEHLQLYRQTSHMLGLAGQLAFALFPVLQISMASSPSGRREEGQ
jgi:hypothetical protein